jgi:hypothetical protein
MPDREPSTNPSDSSAAELGSEIWAESKGESAPKLDKTSKKKFFQKGIKEASSTSTLKGQGEPILMGVLLRYSLALVLAALPLLSDKFPTGLIFPYYSILAITITYWSISATVKALRLNRRSHAQIEHDTP